VSDVTRIGYVIAHEIGHILLGPNAHSIVGIMRGTLLQRDWENAAQGTLGFTQSQNQKIRTWIAERGPFADAQRDR
jgi:Zn-dependent protease with chaperone function